MIRMNENKPRNALAQYTMDGVVVTVYKPRKPRKSERTGVVRRSGQRLTLEARRWR